MEQLLKPMSPPLVAHQLRRVKENRSLLRSVRISFPVLTSLCIPSWGVSRTPGEVSGGHRGGVRTTGGGCQEDTGMGVRRTPGV